MQSGNDHPAALNQLLLAAARTPASPKSTLAPMQPLTLCGVAPSGFARARSRCKAEALTATPRHGAASPGQWCHRGGEVEGVKAGPFTGSHVPGPGTGTAAVFAGMETKRGHQSPGQMAQL